MNFDSDNAVPSTKTITQTRPGPDGGLTIETSLSLKDFPWLEDDAHNGFLVIVSPIPITAVTSPVAASHGAETFVKITAERRKLATRCSGHNKLSMPGGTFMYYDPYGISCSAREFMKTAYLGALCDIPSYLFRPNITTACDPFPIYLITSGFFESDIVGKYSAMTHKGALSRAQMEKGVRELDDAWKKALSPKSACPFHCDFWMYTSTANFFYLEDPTPREKPDEVMKSKIHVYYADFGYRQYRQVKEMTAYLVFYAFCNIFMLYLGMSVISFFHLAFYVPRYAYVMRRYGRYSAVVSPEC